MKTPQFELGEEVQEALRRERPVVALEKSWSDQEIKGKAVTPYLLERLHALSGGRTVAANRALVLNNARLGAAIARSLAGLSPEREGAGPSGGDGGGGRAGEVRAGANAAARRASPGPVSRDEPAPGRTAGGAAVPPDGPSADGPARPAGGAWARPAGARAGGGAMAAFFRRWWALGQGGGRGSAVGAPAAPGASPSGRSR